ncbi:MAG: antitoxin [Acidobacteriota bacterium]
MVERILRLPESLSREVEEAESEALVELIRLGLRQKKIEQALAEYARGRMSLGAAAEMAGLREDEMACQAYARGLQPPSDPQMVDEELG